MGAGVIHQNAAHDICGDGDEVLAVLPGEFFFGETEVSLVDEGGGLKGVIPALATHVGGGQTMEIGVEERQKMLRGGRISCSHRPQKLRYLAVDMHGGDNATTKLPGYPEKLRGRNRGRVLWHLLRCRPALGDIDLCCLERICLWRFPIVCGMIAPSEKTWSGEILDCLPPPSPRPRT